MNCAFNYNYFKAFLIVLPLFILLLFISCSNEDKTGGSDNGGGEIGTNDNTGDGGSSSGNTVAHELEGTWFGYDKTYTTHENYKLEFTVDSDGNITFSPKPYHHVVKLGVTNFRNYTYTGKVETNSITYPYTNDVTCAYLTIQEDGYGKFIFNNSSNCTAKYDRIDASNDAFENEEGKTITDYIGLTVVSVEFTKQ